MTGCVRESSFERSVPERGTGTFLDVRECGKALEVFAISNSKDPQDPKHKCYTLIIMASI